MNNIRDLVRQLAATPSSGAGSMILCRVDSIDTEARTIDAQPLDESAPILGVNLQANQNSEVGVVMFPRQDSYVIVGMLGMCQAVVVTCDDVERVRIDVGDMSVDVSKDGIVLNGGDLGGLVKIQEIKDNLDTLKQYCEALKNATSAGIKAVGAAMSANGATGANAFDAAMSSQSIVFKDMENDKIKQ